MATLPVSRYTLEQYLEAERAAETRSEYIAGEVFAMAGGTRNHAVIAMDTGSRLNEQLRGTRCAVAGSDLRVYCRPDSVMTYPDIVVFCEPAEFLDENEDTLTDATVIVEVLSRSTQKYDRTEKFRFYRGLASLSEYLLLAQSAIRAEHYVKQPDGAWLLREFNGPDAEIVLGSIGCRLVLGTLYERAKFRQ